MHPYQTPGVLKHQAPLHFREATRKDNSADGVELVEKTELGLAQHQRVTSLQNYASSVLATGGQTIACE